MASAVAEFLRTNKQGITDQWEREVADALVPLARLSRPALLDHLPEVLDAFRSWPRAKNGQGLG